MALGEAASVRGLGVVGGGCKWEQPSASHHRGGGDTYWQCVRVCIILDHGLCGNKLGDCTCSVLCMLEHLRGDCMRA